MIYKLKINNLGEITTLYGNNVKELEECFNNKFLFKSYLFRNLNEDIINEQFLFLYRTERIQKIKNNINERKKLI